MSSRWDSACTHTIARNTLPPGARETPGKPWEYHVDMTRQLWDEARHAMMGEVGFLRAGIDWAKFV
ncbi:MAG: hypothetical protein ACREIA_03790, partial [Opitutaceae bacterium]